MQINQLLNEKTYSTMTYSTLYQTYRPDHFPMNNVSTMIDG